MRAGLAVGCGGSLPALFADLRRLDSQNEGCISPALSPAQDPVLAEPSVNRVVAGSNPARGRGLA